MLLLTTIDEEAVKNLLKQIPILIRKKKMVLVNRKIQLSNRTVTTSQALLDLGITISGVWNIVQNLKVEECFRVSNEYDVRRDSNSEVFEFRKIINGKKVYIKLLIDERRGLVCLSFHRSVEKGRR